MKHSQKAWQLSLPTIQAMINHPFNQKLKEGTLSPQIFGLFLKVDWEYLKVYRQVHTQIASRAPKKHQQAFLRYADASMNIEIKPVHQFFKRRFNLNDTPQLTPAFIGYTNHLRHSAIHEPVAVSIAAIVPCLWGYHEVGKQMAEALTEDHPFARWLETYSSPEFDAMVEEIISIFDEVSESATDEVKQKMTVAFDTSFKWELQFFEDAYRQIVVQTPNVYEQRFFKSQPKQTSTPIHSLLQRQDCDGKECPIVDGYAGATGGLSLPTNMNQCVGASGGRPFP